MIAKAPTLIDYAMWTAMGSGLRTTLTGVCLTRQRPPLATIGYFFTVTAHFFWPPRQLGLFVGPS